MDNYTQQVRLIIVSLLFVMILNSQGSAQGICAGPMSLTVQGSESGIPLEIEQFSYDIFCLGLDEGAIELIITGGSPIYSTMWSTGENTPELVDLAAGTYTVTITDDRNCADTLTIDIEEINPLISSMDLIDEDGCGVCTLTDSLATYFYSEVDYMVYIEDIPDGHDLGDVQVCTEIHDETITDNDNPYLRRSWCVDTDEGGSATMRLFFTDEEFKQLMEDADADYIRSTNLFVRVYSGGEGTPDFHEVELTIGDLSLALFDNLENVWSIEFTIEDLPGPSACFYIEYLRDESQKTIDELTSFIENADIRIIENPVVHTVRLEVDHLDCVLSGNIYIEDEIQQLIYKESFVDSRLGVVSIDVSTYAAAMYFLTIEFPKAKISKTYKFIKITN